MKKIFFIFPAFLLSIVTSGQNSLGTANIADQNNKPMGHFCASDEMTATLFKKFPDRQEKMQAIDEHIYHLYHQNKGSYPQNKSVYTIPVVVHIIHNNGLENISNERVIQGIQDLNDAFANMGHYQDASGVDVGVEFCLAQTDPDGNLTNGITRDISTLTNMTKETDDFDLKSLNRWDSKHYLNIWLVNSITSNVNGPEVAGYAHLPSSHGLPEDGIVSEAEFFGSLSTQSTVHIHEVGHYLGLYHTWKGGCVNNDCLSDGDKICDTPPENSTANVPCGSINNTCTSDEDDTSPNNPFRSISNGGIGDQNDLIQNHMDYGDIACHFSFTNDQKDRMLNMLLGFRSSLLDSNRCSSPCKDPINVSFTSSSNTVTIGETINFTSTSTGNISTHDWSVDNTSFSNTKSASYIFNNDGHFWVVLSINNSDPNCIQKDSVLIEVICSSQASFTQAKTQINSGDPLTFTSTSTGATSYEWFIDGVSMSNSQNFTHNFTKTGGYMVYLVTCNDACCDTSNLQLIQVGICGSKEANIWYFGKNKGLDFNTGSPVVLNSSAFKNGFFTEGTATMSDKNGELLFYTDGITVFNKNHKMMLNGDDLWGGLSSTQSALIIKKPGSDHLYYIFTCGQYEWRVQWPSPDGSFVSGDHAYSIVDMNGGGGLGKVISKNQLLYEGTTEKMAAIRHVNGTDVWITTHGFGTDEYYAHLLTCEGLIPDPVISPIGLVIGDSSAGFHYCNGAMAFSPDGSTLATAKKSETSDDYLIELCDFDKSTGKVSNPVRVPTKNNLVSINLAYGLAFSMDGTKLYAGQHKGGLKQYDVSSKSSPAILASKYDISAEPYGAIQRGPDGKIYCRKKSSTTISIVNNPNATGAACDFSNSGIDVGNSESLSLPHFLGDYLSPKQAAKIQGDSSICTTSTYSIKNNCGLDGDSIHWILKGGSSILSQEDNSITLTPRVDGIDTLISDQFGDCGSVADTLLINISCGLDPPDLDIFIPNAFTPNADLLNDNFFPNGININEVDYLFLIYDRWGERIFKSTMPGQGWDGTYHGKLVQEGVYFWKLYYNEENQTSKQLFGKVSVIR